LLSGGDDVITVKGKSITVLAEMLVSAGNDNIELKIYPGLRHSILREKKRRSVFGDILRWLDICNAV
jgi:alpha-beta hydrolase superfamily lysophospholipase